METLLIATKPEKVELITTYLKPHFNLIVVTSLQDALPALEGDIDLITCNVQFGEGQLYDLLRAAKLHPHARSLPFLVIHGSMDVFSPAIRQSIDIATKALGADQFIELAEWRRNLGDAEAFNRVIGIIRQYLPRIVGE